MTLTQYDLEAASASSARIDAQLYVSAGDGRMRVSEAQPEVCNLKGPDLCQSMRDMFRNPEALLVLIEVRFNQQLQPQLSSSEDHRRNGRVLNMLRDDLLYRHRTALLVVTSTSITADWKQYVSPSIVPGDVSPCIDDARSQRKRNSGRASLSHRP